MLLPNPIRFKVLSIETTKCNIGICATNSNVPFAAILLSKFLFSVCACVCVNIMSNVIQCGGFAFRVAVEPTQQNSSINDAMLWCISICGDLSRNAFCLHRFVRVGIQRLAWKWLSDG